MIPVAQTMERASVKANCDGGVLTLDTSGVPVTMIRVDFDKILRICTVKA
ncbi:MAG: hypothetical protein ACRDAM_10870 [Casimicrobium sp.]